MVERGLSLLRYSASEVVAWVPYLLTGSAGGERVALPSDGQCLCPLRTSSGLEFPGTVPEAALPCLSGNQLLGHKRKKN